jgi:hypothetical protein
MRENLPTYIFVEYVTLITMVSMCYVILCYELCST